MLKPILVAATAVIALIPVAARAGEVENRIHNQEARIHQGVADGRLSYAEAHRLDRADDRIQAERNRDLRANGGTLTRAEFESLNRQENELSNRISFDTYDGR